MFSVKEKREISTAIQEVIRKTNHRELPHNSEISFEIRIEGAEAWSWAVIRNNGDVRIPSVNPHNERMDPNDSEKED